MAGISALLIRATAPTRRVRPPRPPGDPQIGRRSRATRSSPSSHTGERAVDDRLAVQERRRGARVAEQDAPGDPRSRRAGAAHRRGCWWGARAGLLHARASPPGRQSVAVGDLPRRRHGRDRCRVFTRLSGQVRPTVSVPASGDKAAWSARGVARRAGWQGGRAVVEQNDGSHRVPAVLALQEPSPRSTWSIWSAVGRRRPTAVSESSPPRA